MTVEQSISALAVHELPGEAVFPESVGVDRRSGDAFVGSLADGTLFRIPALSGPVEIWSPAGADGRGGVAGVKVDDRGRLWVAGGYDGKLFVYDIDARRLLASCDVGQRPSCVNDIAFAPNGDAFLTDSFIPMLFRVDGESLELSAFSDLAEQSVPWAEGLNLNGIVLTPDREALVACQTNLGRFWRFELANGAVQEVELADGPIEHCDGLALDGRSLHVAVNARNLIAVLDLAPDGTTAQPLVELTSSDFAFPTAMAIVEDRTFVVNGQLDRMGGSPKLPFTVAVIGTWRP